MNEKLLNLDQFHARFDTENACADYLFLMKWPNGYECPRCRNRHAYMTVTRRLPLYECTLCRHQASLTVGTVFEGSRTELHKWFTALFLEAVRMDGINAVELSRIIKVTYKTAWLMLQKIRHAMGEEDNVTLLNGFVEVNASRYGRPFNPSINLHPKESPLFIAASMNEQDQPVYVKMKLIPETYLRESRILRTSTKEFAKEHTKPGVSVEFLIDRYISNKLKRLLPLFKEADSWINKTFHGLGPRHLQSYLNEYCYRLNNKMQKSPLFGKLTQLCSACQTVTYSELIRECR